MSVGSREAEQDSDSSSPPLQSPLIEEQALEQDNASAREPGAWGQRWVGPVVGLLLLSLYVAMLARNDLDAAMGRGSLPRLPGGSKSIIAVLALAAASLLGARVWQASRRGESVRVWVLHHPTLLAAAGVTLGAFFLRAFGISDNLPYTSYPDEPAVADRALHILQTGDYNPHYFVYPNLYTYMQAAVYLPRFFLLVSGGSLQNLGGIVPTDFYLWGRLLTSLLGTLTVPLVFLAGRRLYGTAVGLVAAAFMAANSVHLVHSQLITTDVPATFFSALALFAIVRLIPVERIGGPSGAALRQASLASLSRYVVAGVAMGLAIGTKYNSALVLLPFLVAHGYAVAELPRVPGEGLRRFFDRRMWAGLGAMAAAFLLTTPFAIFDLPNFLNDLASVVTHYRFGHAGHEGDDNWRFYVDLFLRTDFAPTLLTLLGVALAFLRHRKADVLLLVFPIAFYFSMSSYRVNFERNMLPILPFTSILAALPLVLAVGWFVKRIGATRLSVRRSGAASAWAVALLTMLAVLPTTASALQRDYRQTQPDNRVRAANWLDANTRPGTKVWLEPLTPDLPPARYLLGHGAHVTEHPAEWYMQNRFEYLVLSAGAYKDAVYDHPESDPPTRDAYLRFFSDNEPRLAVDFEANKVDHPGPSIRIYRTGYTPPALASDVHATHPLDVRFRETGANGSTVQLLGVDLPSSVETGSSMPLTLYWTVDKTMAQDYTVFVHIVDSKGAKLAQRDTGPRSGTYPTSQWQAGDVVVDEAGLDLPADIAPGNYMLRVGLYLQSGNQAVGAFKQEGGPPGSGDDYVVLGPVAVQAAKK